MFSLLFAARNVTHDVSITAPAGTNSLSWALIIFSVVLGLLVALSPSRRTTEIKRSKD
jgi:hypothetical protein